ncbi:uncharacterized protein LOC133031422 [Cannabis sativa]|uniref:uncharacterized protein LOC133031422 n=1 Tax=Cannabis sativa TaxID=3483 RepID=UPI0029C9D0B2|nr:uncharacterized protein LOC133031422 [Cannabis sativa]
MASTSNSAPRAAGSTFATGITDLPAAAQRSQVLSTVCAHQLERFLTGARAQPPATVPDPTDASRFIPNPNLADWMRLDQFLMSWLFNSISEAIVLQLRGMLQSTKKGSTPVDEYILKMRCLADALYAASHAISDDELILYILEGLGSEYDSAIVALTTKHAITLFEVQFLLQTQEMRIEQQHSIAALDLQNLTANYAFALKKASSSSTPSNNTNRGRGSSNGARGRGGRSNPNNRGGNRPICQVFGRAGHISLKCFHRFDLSYQGEPSNNTPKPVPDDSQALLASASIVLGFMP